MTVSLCVVRRWILCGAVVVLAITLFSRSASAQGTIPCTSSNSYGSSGDQHAQDVDVEDTTIQYPTINSALVTQVEKSEQNRVDNGTLGCPVDSYTWTTGVSDTEPTVSALITNWNTYHVPIINDYVTNVANVCPDAGRTGGGYGLAGYYAMLASAGSGMSGLTTVSLGNLAKIELMLYREQYSAYTMNTGTTQPTGAGVFGYINAGGLTYNSSSYPDECAQTSTLPYWSLSQYPAGSTTLIANVTAYCDQTSAPCVTYEHGPFNDHTLPLTFQVNDIYDPVGSGPVPDGTMGYDEGWAGVSMMEATLQQPSGVDLTDFQNTLALAGQWSTAETPVRDENYTAKLVWLLAELYDQTGSSTYKQGLQNKLYNDVLVDVLMDQNNDGYVDGLTSPTVAFSSLTNVAKVPGRMWDGHNSKPDYMAMNAWALVEATVAFYDQSDTTDGTKVEPYAIAMLNNIANEINNIGVPSTGGSQLPIALLLGLWKMVPVDAEQTTPLITSAEKTNWQNAAWRLYNQGVTTAPTYEAAAGEQQPDVAAPDLALYLLYLSGVAYKPLNLR